MKKYLSMMAFVLLMGAVSSIILMGANELTADRIALNAEYAWKTAVLSHHEVEYNDTNFAEVFDENFEVRSAEDGNGNMRYLYVNENTGAVSYQFSGGGLWDTIRGVITLESDFATIKQITVTQQGETPGLGGVVAETEYLNNYKGVKFDETFGIVAVKDTPDLPYEVDAITGATGTSNAFVGLLSVEYRLMQSLFTDVDVNAPVFKAIMNHNDVDFNDGNYEPVFANNFTTTTIDTYTLYTNNQNRNVSFKFTTGGFNGPIDAVVTLDADFITIIGINVLSHSEGMGAIIQTDPQILEMLVGKQFATDDSSLDADGFVDSFGEATTTAKQFIAGLSNARNNYFSIFEEGVDPNKAWQQALLTNNSVAFTEENYKGLFESTFTVETKDDLTLYTNNNDGSLSFLFETEGFVGTIKGVLTLEADFETIVYITVYEQSENWGARIQNEEGFFDDYVGKKFTPEISFVTEPSTEQEIVDGYGGATTTKAAMLEALNTSVQSYRAAFGNVDPDKAWQQALLTNNSVAFTEENYKDLFASSFTVKSQDDLTLYTNNNDGSLSFLFETDGFGGTIKGVLTLEADFETIVYITIYEQSENWGARIQNNEEFFDGYVGKKFAPEIAFVTEPSAEQEIVDGYGGATTTKAAMLEILNTTVQTYRAAFEGEA